jgi:hypothetical protein
LEGKLCAGQEVALVGGGNSAGQAVVYLAGQATKVWLLVRGSEMNTSLLGSRPFCISRHARRAALTSGLCCSVACSVFFIGQFQMQQKTPDGGPPDFDLERCQLFPQRRDRQIGLRRDQSSHLVFMLSQRVPLMARNVSSLWH